ncbi:YdcF family protein [Sinorhizobium sp. BJ1]|uniref:YdcF family protein n=1 Tax=Sinorhizobium sp. BJ1 TaxID=2035455 RepID=UPI000BE9FC55|nr:YdcF family protein [Sinorhizobium sp. BJ1]PDT80326.1 hypothetical protein CO676_28585 [Sinorhizobium sp. BJ1]
MADRGKWRDRAARRRRSRSLLRKILRRGFFALLALLAVFVAGFLQFADTVASMQPPPAPRADGIVVLTGGFQRIEQAVELLKSGAGRRLLISGVHPTTTGSQIRRNTQSSADLFRCCVDIGHEAIDTIGNATEAAQWIHDRGYRSILVVTNNYHMPRSLLELRRVRPDTEFIAYPVVNSDLKTSNWLRNPLFIKAILLEYAKYSIASLRDLASEHLGNN